MCIAIYSLKGNPVPDEQTLKNCFRNNSDGAGFAFNTDGGKVQILKGFMTFDEFYEAFSKYDRKYNLKNRGVLIHFRIATHGGTNKACCHPFPVSDNEKLLKCTCIKTKYAAIHNGIIEMTSTEANRRKNMSDTMVFIEKYLSKITTNPNWFNNPQNFELIYNLIDSKMAILSGDGTVHATIGFKKAKDGNFYSNNSYEEYYGLYNFGYYGYGLWDDYPEYFEDCIEKMPLMKLKRGETAIFEDGSTEEYNEEYHTAYPTYINELGEIYGYYEEKPTDKNVPFEKLTYLGEGSFISAYSSKTVPFRIDTFTSCEI